MKKAIKHTFIDLFAGCGGLSEGFLQSKRFEGLAHVEWELPMVETLRNRLKKQWKHTSENAFKRVVHFDIQKSDELIEGNWSEESVKDFGGSNHKDTVVKGLRGLVGEKKVDLIIGGPPCQAYSIAGRAQDKNSMEDDYRNFLFESFIKVVSAFQPEMFVFENVPGMLSAAPGGIPVTHRVSKAFSEVGYTIKNTEDLKQAVFTSSDFGVPQKRNRLIMIGIRDGSSHDLESIYSTIRQHALKTKSRTVRDAIGDLPALTPLDTPYKKNGRNISHVPLTKEMEDVHHIPRYHNPRDINVFRDWIVKDMNKKSMLEKIKFYNLLLKKRSNHAKYRNLEWDKPSPTIVAHLHKDGLMFIHPDKNQARSITVREAALLQSFPENYEFLGSQGSCYKMIGNAVPPQMACTIAKGISSVLERETVS
ncbi:MAG: DNA (cytosine-5-)-methyltransferase [Crocinitomicaceae bacterium]|nr:DNA (cytosine-5-)-methyltransferase [Crocinitomicaceae bacterium]|tara:strand:+ start:4648 stop:5910 length:1263 start_codon:yes stop_codon:yes gene_type:complete